MSESLLKFFSLLVLSLTGIQAYADTVDDWLDKMSLAMNQQNYQGILIIRQNDKLQSIKVMQGVTARGSWQTLESLTGEEQKIIRNNDRVTTIFPAKRLITIAENSERGPLHPVLPENRNTLKKLYSLKLTGQDRIANKTTQVLQIIPRDDHRYGYTFWLDNKSGLLLKCDLMDEKGRVLEQLMYSDIELLTDAPDQHVDAEKLSLYQKIYLSDKPHTSKKNWAAIKLPVGFMLTRSIVMENKDKQRPSYHMVYSDGMASVSVFIEHGKKDQKPAIGQSTMGPVNAYSSFIDDTYVTAIGEVPVATVRMIAQSMQSLQ